MYRQIYNNRSMSMRDLLPNSTDHRYYKPNVFQKAPTREPEEYIDDDERTIEDIMEEAIEKKRTPRQMRELIKEMVIILTEDD